MENILKSARQDWMYIILSTISGFLMIGFYFVLASILKDESTAFLITFILFSLLFDVRHFFPTYTRTFLDKEYFREHKSWLLGSTAAIVLIPLVFYFTLIQGEVKANNSYIVLAFARRVTLILGFYHLIKQNWGFIAIYKKKFKEPEDGSDRWEKLLLLSGSFIPFVYLAKSRILWFADERLAFAPDMNESPYVLEFWGKISAFMLVLGLFFLVIGFAINARPQYKFVSRNLGYYFIGIFILIKLILVNGSDKVLKMILICLAVLFVFSLILTLQKAFKFGKLNIRKWAMLMSALVLYWGVLSLPIDNTLIIIGITIPHNIQYLSFVGLFNKKHYSGSTRNHGLAAILSQKVIFFFIVSVLFSFVFELGRTGTALDFFTESNSIVLKNLIAFLFLSLVMHHYYLDAVIWRVRKDENLGKDIFGLKKVK
jgi:hypothetical protein